MQTVEESRARSEETVVELTRPWWWRSALRMLSVWLLQDCEQVSLYSCRLREGTDARHRFGRE